MGWRIVLNMNNNLIRNCFKWGEGKRNWRLNGYGFKNEKDWKGYSDRNYLGSGDFRRYKKDRESGWSGSEFNGIRIYNDGNMNYWNKIKRGKVENRNDIIKWIWNEWRSGRCEGRN